MSEFEERTFHVGEGSQIDGSWIYHPLCYGTKSQSKCVGSYAKEYAEPIAGRQQSEMKCIRVIAKVDGEKPITFNGAARIEHELHWLGTAAEPLRDRLEAMEEYTHWRRGPSTDC